MHEDLQINNPFKTKESLIALYIWIYKLIVLNQIVTLTLNNSF